MLDKDYLIKGNMYQYNLGWLIDTILSFKSDLDTAIDLKTIKYADPIEWDITTQYAANMVVVDPKSGTAYMSKTAVPSGILLDNTTYWVVVFNYQEIYNKIMDGVAFNDRKNDYASRDLAINDLVWYAGELYRVTKDIANGSKYIVDTNISKISIGSLLKNYLGNDRTASVTSDKLTASGDITEEASNKSVTVSGDLTIKAGDLTEGVENKTVTATGDITEEASNKSVTVSGDLTIKAGDLTEGVENKTVTATGDITEEASNYRGKFTSATIEFPNKTVDLEKIKYNDWIFADDVGCKGDGTTDDTDALQQALNSYRLVYLTAGKIYKISKIKITNTLDGNDASITLTGNADNPIEPSNNSVIQNLTINCDNAIGTYVTLAWKLDNVTYTNVRITFPYSLSFSASNSTNITYNNCTVYGSKNNSGFWSILTGQSDGENANIQYNNCTASKNALDGFNLAGYGYTLNHCVAHDNGTNPPSESLGASGFYLDHNTSARDIVFNDCIAYNNTERGLSIEAPSQRVTVIGGHYYKNALSGIHIAPSQRVTILGAKCTDNGSWSGTSGSPESYQKAGIDFSAVLGLVICGNQCFETRDSALQTQEYGIIQYGSNNVTGGIIALNSCGYNKINSYNLLSMHLPSGVFENLNAPI